MRSCALPTRRPGGFRPVAVALPGRRRPGSPAVFRPASTSIADRAHELKARFVQIQSQRLGRPGHALSCAGPAACASSTIRRRSSRSSPTATRSRCGTRRRAIWQWPIGWTAASFLAKSARHLGDLRVEKIDSATACWTNITRPQKRAGGQGDRPPVGEPDDPARLDHHDNRGQRRQVNIRRPACQPPICCSRRQP